MDFDGDFLKKKLHPNIKIIYRIYLYIHEHSTRHGLLNYRAASLQFTLCAIYMHVYFSITLIISIITFDYAAGQDTFDWQWNN